MTCLGFTIPTNVTSEETAAQPAEIEGNPNSYYMHINSQAADAAGIKNTYFILSSGTCFGPESYFTKMNSDINTVGKTGVTLSFWWMMGGAATIYGEVYYSTDEGSTWTLLASNLNNQQTWTKATYAEETFNNKETLRFGFRWYCGNATAATDPAFAIDDINVTADCPGCDVNTIPQNPVTGAVRSTSATVKWDVQPCVWRYRVYWREVGTTQWNVTPAGANAGRYVITGLMPSTNYEWEVRTSCFQSPFTKSKPSVRKTFRTKGGERMEGDDLTQPAMVYPNPNNGNFIVSINNAELQNTTVRVVNMIGQEVYFENTKLNPGQNTIRLNLAGNPPGLYIVTVESGEATVTEKVMIE